MSIDFLRTVACLSIVMLHSIKFEIGFSVTEIESTTSLVLIIISGLLAFGTPAFIVISEILLSYSYPNKIPEGFWSKRVKFILMPFVFMSLLYAFAIQYVQPERIALEFIYNLLGDYHGWFILVIFQFYFLHHLFTKYFQKYSALKILIITFTVNAIYMGVFNYYSPSTSSDLIDYIWDRGYWIPFPGWVFYFTVAYYLGRNYHNVIKMLVKYKLWIYLSLPISISLVVYINKLASNINFGSKQFEMVFLTFSVIGIVFLLTRKIKEVPLLVDLISRYSFGIYLLHWVFLMIQRKLFSVTQIDLGYLNILVYFIVGVLAPIISVHVLNKFNFGKYIVGNVKRRKKTVKNEEKIAV